MLGGLDLSIRLGRYAEDAQGVSRHIAGDGNDFLPSGIVQWFDSVFGQNLSAVIQDDFRRTLGIGDNPIRGLMQGGHAFRFGCEGDLLFTREFPVECFLLQPGLGCRDNECAFRGIAFDIPISTGIVMVVWLDGCIGCQRGSGQHLPELPGGSDGCRAVRGKLSHGSVSRSADGVGLSGHI